MRKIADITVYWWDLPWKPKTEEERIQDEGRAMEILRQLQGRKGIRVVEVRPERSFYRLKVEGEDNLGFLMEVLQPVADLVSPFDIRKIYSDRELSSAPLLVWLLTNQAIEDDYYTLYFKEGQAKGIGPYTRNCEACGAPLEQVRDMWVETSNMGKRDLSLTYGFEVILSARLVQMLQQTDFTGFTLRPVWSYRKPYQGEPRLFQLVVTNVLPPMASPPTQFEEDWPRPKECAVCGRRTYYLEHTHFWGRIQYYEETEVYYRKAVLESSQDFNIAHERFGELRGSHQMIIISPRVYGWLKEQGVKGWEAEPVVVVE